MGKKTYRQVKNKDGTSSFVEVSSSSLPSDLRFDEPFVSPVDGSIIRNKRDLHEHNRRNGTVQMLPGMDQDMAAIAKENQDRIDGTIGKRQRIEALRRALES